MVDPLYVMPCVAYHHGDLIAYNMSMYVVVWYACPLPAVRVSFTRKTAVCTYEPTKPLVFPIEPESKLTKNNSPTIFRPGEP